VGFIRKRIAALLDPNKVRLYLFRGAEKKTICNIVVGTVAYKADHQTIIFDRMEKALRLIESYDGKRFAQIQRYIKSIFICGDPTAHGYWHQELQMCELQEEFVRNENTSVAQVGSAIVHEVTHARLMRLGFGYEEPKRLRIERICLSAERAFALRLPDGEELVKAVEEAQAYYSEGHFSNAGRREADLEGLRMLGVPKWIVWLLAKVFS
jgi:hypothetical protein